MWAKFNKISKKKALKTMKEQRLNKAGLMDSNGFTEENKKD